MTSTNVFSDIQRHVPIVGDMTLKDPIAYKATRLMARAINATQMALAEAYINGLEIPDAVFRSLLHTSMPILFQHAPGLLVPYEWVLKETDLIAEGAQSLMKVQYDLPQDMFDVMLGHSQRIYPKYTMGLWEKGATTLEQAQIDMLDDAIGKIGIKDGDDILDIGCGWGAAANHILAKFPNATCTGLNLSHAQCEWLRQHKMQDPESHLSTDRFALYEGDFNNAVLDKKFDKIITIGVFEHVGNLTNAFQKLASFLKSNGKVFIHIITVRIPNNMSSGFTHKYIFPHGRYWNYDVVPSHNRDLKTVSRWYVNGMNYHKTLTAWLQRFDDAQERVRLLDYGMDYTKFRRIWRFYLLLLGTIFATCDGEYNGNGQYLMTHA